MTTLTADKRVIDSVARTLGTLPRRSVGRVAAVKESASDVQALIRPFRRTGSVVDDFEFQPGMIYTAVRAISARINQNYDSWPSKELAKSYQTFLGKPCFVNHANFDPDRARGRVVAARYVENGRDKYIETVMEIDAMRFPMLGEEIRTGGLDSVSMGVEAGFTICSFCGNKATDVFDMCDHVKFHKGSHLPDPKTGKPKLVYEDCFKLGFFELSYVFDPADETAVVSKVIVANAFHRYGGTFIPREGANPPDPDQPVFVHYNRHAFNRQKRTGEPQADLWSIRQEDPETKKHVRGYMDNVHLTGARMHVQPGGSQLYKDTYSDERGEGDRTVHAGIWGKLHPGPAPEDLPHSIVGYNPKHNSTFVHKDTGEQVDDADHVHMDPSGAVHAYKADGWGRQQTARRKKAWGETTAPEDIDTLRQDEDESDDDYEFVSPYRPREDDMPFQNSNESPPELQTPDFDQTKRLDRDQEAEGLDTDRRVEDVEEVGAPSPVQAQPIAARKQRRKAMGRTRTRRNAAEEDGRPPWLQEEEEAPAPEDAGGLPPEEDSGGEEEEGGFPDEGGGFPEDEGGDEYGAADSGGGIEEVVSDLAEDIGRLQDELGLSDEGGDDVEEEMGSEGAPPPPLPGPADPAAGLPPQFAAGRGNGRQSGRSAARRPVNSRSPQKKGRKGQKGTPVGAPSLSERSKVAAAARQRNQRVADTSGHTDGGPYGENDLGEQAETFIPSAFGEGDGVPPAESVAAPTGDGSKAPNSEGSLVARIQAKSRSLQADIDAYNRMRQGGSQRQAEGVAEPGTVNPPLSGTDDQSLKGSDFQSVGLSDTETQPKDASRHWFAQFNNWLTQVTGQPWQGHTAGRLTRAAARWSEGSGVPLDALFPTLQTALRHAGRSMTADEKLEVAAPDDRVDVEKPVSGETDADAQASQFDLHDFGNNAGDNLADPEMSSDSQIWAPGEGESAARSAAREKMADGLLAMRCAEAYVRANLAPPSARWKLASWLQTIRHSTVEDRTKLLEAVVEANRQALTAARVPVGRTRGATRGTIPPGFGSGRVASTARESALDPKYDAMMWMG